MGDIKMKPKAARVVVELTICVEVGAYGEGWSITEAIEQACHEATNRVHRVLGDKANGISVLSAKGARLVCDAERDHG